MGFFFSVVSLIPIPFGWSYANMFGCAWNELANDANGPYCASIWLWIIFIEIFSIFVLFSKANEVTARVRDARVCVYWYAAAAVATMVTMRRYNY